MECACHLSTVPDPLQVTLSVDLLWPVASGETYSSAFHVPLLWVPVSSSIIVVDPVAEPPWYVFFFVLSCPCSSSTRPPNYVSCMLSCPHSPNISFLRGAWKTVTETLLGVYPAPRTLGCLYLQPCVSRACLGSTSATDSMVTSPQHLV